MVKLKPLLETQNSRHAQKTRNKKKLKSLTTQTWTIKSGVKENPSSSNNYFHANTLAHTCEPSQYAKHLPPGKCVHAWMNPSLLKWKAPVRDQCGRSLAAPPITMWLSMSKYQETPTSSKLFPSLLPGKKKNYSWILRRKKWLHLSMC